MPRSLFRDTVAVRGSAGMVPLAGAAVSFYVDPERLTPFAKPLYPDGTSTLPVAQPFITGSLGELEVWADDPVRLYITATAPGYVPAREAIDLEPDPVDAATEQDVANAILAHEAAENPHPVYLTEPEGDQRYLPVGWLPPGEYLTESEGDARYPLKTDPDPYPQYLTTADADLTYEQLSRKGAPSGYVPLDPNGLVPNQYLPPLAITDSYVVANEAEMLALDAQKGDIAIRTDDGVSYVLGVEPASEAANWYAMGGAGAGGNTSIIRDQEWAVSTGNTVTLADTPTGIFTVTRNGVAQSQTLGHFVWAGTTLTFADAFEAGEYVTATYQIGTSGSPVDAYTKSESDLRYLQLAGGELTGQLVLADGDQSSGGLILSGDTGGWIKFGGGVANIAYYYSGANTRLLVDKWTQFQGALTVGISGVGKAVDRSPDAGNTLEWRNNGFYSAATVPDLSAYYTKTESDARYQLATAHPKITVNATAPSSPATGDLWIW